MRIPEICARCLYDRQAERSDNAEYLSEIKELIDNRSEDDTSPYMVFQFNKVHEELFGKTANWACVVYHRARAKIKEEMEA